MAAQLPLTVPDVVCIDDIDQNGLETTSDLQTLEQDVYHLLIEIKGSNIDDITRGLGIEGLLSAAANRLGGKAQEIESQLQQDARIVIAIATVSILPPGTRLPDGTTFAGTDAILELTCVAVRVPLADVYRGVELVPPV